MSCESDDPVPDSKVQDYSTRGDGLLGLILESTDSFRGLEAGSGDQKRNKMSVWCMTGVTLLAKWLTVLVGMTKAWWLFYRLLVASSETMW